MTVGIDPLDALIADMIAETGLPADEAERWADEALARAAARDIPGRTG